jgi:exodeoxyribonuclease VII small subunit
MPRTKSSERQEETLPTYREAVEELETILAEIEDDSIDLDELAQRVERAAKLIALCRAKIRDTEFKVKTIIDGLEQPEEN